MKILYNHQIFLSKYGGASRYFVELANNISLNEDKDATVKIISPFFKTEYLSSNNQNFFFSGMKIPDFKGSSKLCSILNTFLSPILSKYYNPNIIHDTYYRAVKHNTGHIKKIITVHDMISCYSIVCSIMLYNIMVHEMRSYDIILYSIILYNRIVHDMR